MKRFSETEKWKDVWFRGLKPCEKLVFLYVVDNCNNAGFYEADLGMMEFQTGVKMTHLEGALKGLNRGLKEASGWFWVRRFLRHQKNDQLNPENPAHKQIIALIEDQLERFGEVPEFREFLGPIKGLFSPHGKGIGNGKRKEVQEEGEEEWLESLKSDTAYSHLSIPDELSKMRRWCTEHRKQPTRRRFISWINRAEKPIGSNGASAPSTPKIRSASDVYGS